MGFRSNLRILVYFISLHIWIHQYNPFFILLSFSFDLPGLQVWRGVPVWFPVCAAGCRPPSHSWTTVSLKADRENYQTTWSKRETTVFFVEHLLEMTESRSAGHGPVYVHRPMKRANFPCLVFAVLEQRVTSWVHTCKKLLHWRDTRSSDTLFHLAGGLVWRWSHRLHNIQRTEPASRQRRCLCSDTSQRQNHSTLEGVIWSPCIYYDFLLSNLSDQYLPGVH